MDLLEGFEQEHKTKFFKVLSDKNGFEAAAEFLDNEKPKVDNLVKQLGLTDLFITEGNFQEKLDKVLSFKTSSTVNYWVF